MHTRMFLAALLMLPLTAAVGFAAQNAPPAADPEAGRIFWKDGSECKNCHGVNGEGGFGPALAGQKIAVDRFKTALRAPIGVMPSYPVGLVSDTEVADLAAYFASLPESTPGNWRYEIPKGAPKGQALAVGCIQCHQLKLGGPRGSIAAVAGDYDYFARLVYQHDTAMPKHTALVYPGTTPARLKMGNYDTTRLPEADLRKIYSWMHDELGLRALLHGRLSAGEVTAKGATYGLALDNTGLPGKARSAQDVAIRLVIPAGSKVVSATGEGYQGMHMDKEMKAPVAVWKVPLMAPGYRETFLITLSKPSITKESVRGHLRWSKPDVKLKPYEQADIYAGKF